jgi:hypothetical protein
VLRPPVRVPLAAPGSRFAERLSRPATAMAVVSLLDVHRRRAAAVIAVRRLRGHGRVRFLRRRWWRPRDHGQGQVVGVFPGVGQQLPHRPAICLPEHGADRGGTRSETRRALRGGGRAGNIAAVQHHRPLFLPDRRRRRGVAHRQVDLPPHPAAHSRNVVLAVAAVLAAVGTRQATHLGGAAGEREGRRLVRALPLQRQAAELLHEHHHLAPRDALLSSRSFRGFSSTCCVLELSSLR